MGWEVCPSAPPLVADRRWRSRLQYARSAPRSSPPLLQPCKGRRLKFEDLLPTQDIHLKFSKSSAAANCLESDTSRYRSCTRLQAPPNPLALSCHHSVQALICLPPARH